MAHRNRITIAQSQRLSLNASLVTGVRLLRADAAGLTAWLEEQAAENPALVLTRPRPRDWLPRWNDALSRLSGAGGEDQVAGSPGLAAHVMAGIAGLGLAPADRMLAEALVDALEPTGWLGQPLARIAAEAGVPVARAGAVLDRLQQIEPAGLFARDLAECLRLQAQDRGELDAVMAGVLSRLPLVAAGRIAAIAAALGVDGDSVEARIDRLRRYDPKPGLRFAHGAAPVAEPDLVARRTDAGWEIGLNRSSLPELAVAGGRGPGHTAARALLRLVEGRNATLLRVAREMIVRQAAALERGLGALEPMTMAEIAAATGLHQSTVSRVVAGTSVDVGRATWWLRALFSAAPQGGGPSAVAIRDALARLVAAEDPARPLTDEALALALAGGAAPVARRTVAKYRAMLGIPPAGRRRRASSPCAGP